MAITYKDAGVDIDASNAAKKRIRQLARETFTPYYPIGRIIPGELASPNAYENPAGQP